MSKQVPASSATDLNLLFGILALQMDFITNSSSPPCKPGFVIKARRWEPSWSSKSPYDARLVLLQGLVDEHLKQHHNDPQQSLAAVAAAGFVKDELEKFADTEVHASS